jgi:hypothetical protein
LIEKVAGPYESKTVGWGVREIVIDLHDAGRQ